MYRRQYLIGAGGTVSLVGTASASPERVRPAGDSIEVATGTTVLFELADGDDPEWYVDGEGPLADPFPLGYAEAAGTATFSRRFEEPGWYEVYARDGEEPSWSVAVAGDGTAPPTVEDVRTEPAEGPISVDDPVEVVATATDPGDRLDRIVLQEGRNQVEAFVEGVEGREASARFTFSEPPHWIEAGYPSRLLAVTEDGRVSDVVEGEGPTVRPPFSVSIVETNAPVRAGDRLEVTVEVTDDSWMLSAGDRRQEVELVVGDEGVDAETVSPGYGETATITLGYETYPVETDVEFPVVVASPDDTDRTTVSVFADGPAIEVEIVGTNEPVSAGERLEVDATVENPGSTDLDREVRMVVGGERVDAETVTVPAESTVTVTLGYETYPVETDVEFSVAVETDDDAASSTVRVLTDG